MRGEVVKQPSGVWENAKVIIQALLLALVIRTFLFQAFTIPSGSMIPTLLVGDYVLVNKFAYGYSKYSLPFSFDLFGGRIMESTPHRGDVVVFRFPRDTNVDFIKRVVGLPGDRIQLKDEVLYINGEPAARQPHGTFTSDEELDPGDHVPVFKETLSTGKSYDTMQLSVMSPGANTQEYVVPTGSYFMMGDNRDNSDDSRFDVGFVPAENLVGRASFIFFSLSHNTAFYEFWRWPLDIRWSRLFKIID